MRILILNASPRPNGTVATLLKTIAGHVAAQHEVEWVDVCRLQMKFCTACMLCREKNRCILPEDDAHRVAEKIRAADALVVGTPTHWGNMSAPLKLLFDRTVPVFMGEKPGGLPIPRQKGKRAVIVTACTTPWPFNFLLPESRGAIRAVREVLHYGGYKIVGKIVRPGTRKSGGISAALAAKTGRIAQKLVK